MVARRSRVSDSLIGWAVAAFVALSAATASAGSAIAASMHAVRSFKFIGVYSKGGADRVLQLQAKSRVHRENPALREVPALVV
jgi:hypothetical protein